MRALLMGLLAITSTACVTAPPGPKGGFQTPPPEANFGATPNVTEDARRYFEARLKDPGSAEYRLGRVGRAHCNKGRAWGGGVTWYGHAANVYVNAKNSFGGYTGFQDYTFLWNPDGTLNRRIDGADFGALFGDSGLCRWMVDEAG